MRRVLVASALLGVGGCSFLVDADGLTDTEAASSSDGSPEDGSLGPGIEGASSDATAESGDDPDGATLGDALKSDVTATGSAYAAAVLADSPLMYLRFGDLADSSSPRDETGKVQVSNVGVPVFGVPGAIANDPDTAVSLDQSGFDCGNGFDFIDQQPFTIELWAIIPNDVVQNEPRFLLRKGDFYPDGAAPAEAYSLYLSQGTVWTSAVFSRRANGVSNTTDTVVSADSTYHHIVAIYTGAYLHLYRDGHQYGSDVADGLSGAKQGHLYVGLRDAFNGYVRTSIDELAIYDHELADDRVQLHYAIGHGTAADQ